MNSPAFQFYVQDFLTGTMFLSAEEIGAYILLLCHQWDKGALPVDDRELLRIARTKVKTLEVVRKKFVLGDDGLLRNTRLEKEREKQAQHREKQKLNGSKGGRPMKENPRVNLGSEEESQSEAKKSSSTSSSTSTSFSFSTDNSLNKKTRVGNQEFEKAASQLMWERFEQGITEMMMGQFRTLRLQDVMREVDQHSPSGTIYTNDQHLLNKFRAVATRMLGTKKDKPSKLEKHDYSQYKRRV
jgi:uncharacterized protein YdaU (DUF1376 family)